MLVLWPTFGWLAGVMLFLYWFLRGNVVNAKWCLPSASVVGHKTNNGGRRNSLTALRLPVFGARQCWSYDQHLVWRKYFYSTSSLLRLLVEKTNNGGCPMKYWVEIDSNSGFDSLRMVLTTVGVLKLSVLKRRKMLSLRFDCWSKDQQRRAAKLHESGGAKTLSAGKAENAKPSLRLLTE